MYVGYFFGVLHRNPLLALQTLADVAMPLPASCCDVVLLQTSVYVYHSAFKLNNESALLMGIRYISTVWCIVSDGQQITDIFSLYKTYQILRGTIMNHYVRHGVEEI